VVTWFASYNFKPMLAGCSILDESRGEDMNKAFLIKKLMNMYSNISKFSL